MLKIIQKGRGRVKGEREARIRDPMQIRGCVLPEAQGTSWLGREGG